MGNTLWVSLFEDVFRQKESPLTGEPLTGLGKFNGRPIRAYPKSFSVAQNREIKVFSTAYRPTNGEIIILLLKMRGAKGQTS